MKSFSRSSSCYSSGLMIITNTQRLIPPGIFAVAVVLVGVFSVFVTAADNRGARLRLPSSSPLPRRRSPIPREETTKLPGVSTRVSTLTGGAAFILTPSIPQQSSSSTRSNRQQLRNDYSIETALLPSSLAPRNSHHNINVKTSLLVLHAKKKKKKRGHQRDANGEKTICVNRVAYRNYEILETLEAGICLVGTEVKSVREGKMNLRDGYVRPTKNGRSCVLYNVHIAKHSHAGEYFQHEERRPRTLLVHKEQARKYMKQTEQRGMTVVPIKAYLNSSNILKIQIALCRGKNVRDKRETIKQREAKREESRIIKSFRI